MHKDISRRGFVQGGLGLGLGSVALGELPGLDLRTNAAAGVPMIITSHENETGQEAMRQSWQILTSGGSALDAVEKGANVIEVDPDDHSVGYAGLPNEHGVVQLDASIMDGKTYSAGSVASLENIMNPSSVARLVMERTDHVMLIGRGALDFARSFGFEEVDLLTPEAREIWLRWRERRSDGDDWGPPEHLKGRSGGSDRDADAGAVGPLGLDLEGPDAFHYGTTNVLAVDSNGDIAGITTTSGLSWKLNGRIGDSPVIGAGLYVDNSVGAAGATGRGEDVIKSCASYFIVMRMREGRSPQEACEDAIEMIVDRYRAVGLDFIPSEKFVAINKAGEYGAARMGGRGIARMSVRTPQSLEIYEGTASYVP